MIAGLLESGAILARKNTLDPNQLLGMTRHFVWVIPLSNTIIFLALGLIAAPLALLWPRQVRWILLRALCALALLPMFLVAFPRIHDLALAIVALGIAARAVPLFERNSQAQKQLIRLTFPIAVATLLAAATTPWVIDQIRLERENSRPLPSPGSPSVLLIVLDTVAARHLSLHGYARETSPTLNELAERGIRFDLAQAPSPWTLPSHASMFTGRWLHELSVGWLTPLDRSHPTLADFLGEKGYATSGFVANTTYCARDSGLARGFTHYQDFIFPALTFFKPAILVNRLVIGLRYVADILEAGLELARLRPAVEHFERLLDDDRKDAATLNREFLAWLSNRAQPQRPFFAFLNYFDAHYPYKLPQGRRHRFGAEPTETNQRILIRDWFRLCRKGLPPPEMAFAMAAYDDCIADLDEQLGKLVDELTSRGVLNETYLIVTSDHGESFGEHDGIYCHGTSLYQTELHVPLLIIPPRGLSPKRAVKEAASLRDLAATVVDLLGLKAVSPFPGHSLARFWNGGQPSAPADNEEPDRALAELALPTVNRSRDRTTMPRRLWPQGALTENDWSYIWHEGDGREELFHLAEDAAERRNRAGDDVAQPTLRRMRNAFARMTTGPLLPPRFSP